MKYKIVSFILVSVLAMGSCVNAIAATKDKFSTSIGVDYYNKDRIDTSDEAAMFDKYMRKLGFKNNLVTDIKSNDWKDKYQGKLLAEGNVLLLAGIGSRTNIYFNYRGLGNRYATGLTTGPSGRRMAGSVDCDMFGVDDNYWGETVLAIFCGCETASGGPGSLTHSVHRAGADVSIGWREVIRDSDADKWVKSFGRHLSDNERIKDAMDLAIINNRFEDPSAIKSVLSYTINSSNLSLRLGDYVNGRSTLSVESEMNDDTCIQDNITYSFRNKDLSEIFDYIRDNYDSQFNQDRFEITEITEAMDDDGNVVCGGITLDYKIGDFVTEDNYFISVIDDKVDKIYINGNPYCNRNDVLSIDVNPSDEELKEMALSDLSLEDDEEIREQKILKRFDSTPYYSVITIIENSEMETAHSEIFNYRV